MKWLKPSMTRRAFETVAALKRDRNNVQANLLNAVRSLPLLLRRHGLLAVTAHGLTGNDTATKHVAEAFIAALAEEAPFRALDAEGRIRELAGEPLRAYLLHSQVAMVLADAWVRVAESVLDEAGRAARVTQPPEREVSDASA